MTTTFDAESAEPAEMKATSCRPSRPSRPRQIEVTQELRTSLDRETVRNPAWLRSTVRFAGWSPGGFSATCGLPLRIQRVLRL